MKTPQPFYEELAWPTPAGRAFLCGPTFASGSDAGSTFVSTGVRTPVRWSCSPDPPQQAPCVMQGACFFVALETERYLPFSSSGGALLFHAVNGGQEPTLFGGEVSFPSVEAD